MLITNQLFIFIFSMMMHPVHVSLTNIEYNKAKKSFEITLKFFKDDFNTIIFKSYNSTINLNDNNFLSAEKQVVSKYVNANLWCNDFAGKFSPKQIVKKQIDELSVWYFFEIPAKKAPRKLIIKNTFLLDLYTDQTNLLIVKVGEQELSEMYSKDQTQNLYDFSKRIN